MAAVDVDQDEPHEETRTRRTRRLLRANVQAEYSGYAEVMLRDISDGGVGATSPVPLLSGERIAIDLPNIGTVIGQVRWSNGRRFGIAFDEPIDSAKVVAAPQRPAGVGTVRIPVHEGVLWRPGVRMRT